MFDSVAGFNSFGVIQYFWGILWDSLENSTRSNVLDLYDLCPDFFIGAVQKLRNANFGHFSPPSPYVTNRNVSVLPPMC